MTTVLDIDGLHARYGKNEILTDIDLSVGGRETVAVLGRNGTGKSSIMLSTLGLGPEVTDGEIMVKEESVLGLAPEQVFERGVSWVPAHRRIFPNLSVEENLKLGYRDEENDEILELIHDSFPLITESPGMRGGSLSGGQQQMLAISRGIVSNPDLVLIDEPFEGLMPSICERVVELLAKLPEYDMSMLLAGQVLQYILRLVDRVYIIERGRIIQEMAASEIASADDLKEQYFAL